MNKIKHVSNRKTKWLSAIPEAVNIWLAVCCTVVTLFQKVNFFSQSLKKSKFCFERLIHS